MKREDSYTSRLRTHVHFMIYEPKVILRVKAVVIIEHDLTENLSHYDALASYLLNQGYVVVVSDLPGHGQSLIDFEQGYFGKEETLPRLVEDLHHLHHLIFEDYNDVPYFFLGVGLGASLIRLYASVYGEYIQGMILVSSLAKLNNHASKSLILKIMGKVKGDKYHPNIKYLKINKHHKDIGLHPFSYTVKGYKDIYRIITTANTQKTIVSTPKHLQILLLGGKNDLMIHRGKDTEDIARSYQSIGVEDVTVCLYPEGGHQLLKSEKKREIFKDILDFLNQRTYL